MVWVAPIVRRRVAAEFPKTDQAPALAILTTLTAHESERVMQCVVTLAQGSLTDLERHVANARRDYRDVIMGAENYATDRHRRLLAALRASSPSHEGLALIEGLAFRLGIGTATLGRLVGIPVTTIDQWAGRDATPAEMAVLRRLQTLLDRLAARLGERDGLRWFIREALWDRLADGRQLDLDDAEERAASVRPRR